MNNILRPTIFKNILFGLRVMSSMGVDPINVDYFHLLNSVNFQIGFQIGLQIFKKYGFEIVEFSAINSYKFAKFIVKKGLPFTIAKSKSSYRIAKNSCLRAYSGIKKIREWHKQQQLKRRIKS